jgi:hypothetical protein
MNEKDGKRGRKPGIVLFAKSIKKKQARMLNNRGSF